MGTFSVPSLKGERQFDFLIEEVGMGYDDFLIEWVVIGLWYIYGGYGMFMLGLWHTSQDADKLVLPTLGGDRGGR